MSRAIANLEVNIVSKSVALTHILGDLIQGELVRFSALTGSSHRDIKALSSQLLGGAFRSSSVHPVIASQRPAGSNKRDAEREEVQAPALTWMRLALTNRCRQTILTGVERKIDSTCRL